MIRGGSAGLALVLAVGSAGLGVAAVTVGAAPPAAAAGNCTATTATATIDTAAPAYGERIAFHGSGWTTCSGSGSSVAVKMIDAAGTKYARPDTSVNADSTVWAVVHAGASGSFTGSFVLPDGSAATSQPALPQGTLQLAFLTGSLDDTDPIRSVRASFAIGDATEPTDPTQPTDPTEPTDPATTCTPTTETARVQVPRTASLGGTLHITGTGWCNPAGGGSVIGVKLDDGGYAHLDDSVDANRTIWAKVRADDSDGTFAADLTLPDGTASTSAPAFTRGAHTLRLLSGSLAAGDQVRSVESSTFTIGAYRPNALPDPIDAESLTSSARHGLRVTRTGHVLHVTAPRLPRGTWVYPSLYAADGSPRTPWTSWHRIGTRHGLRLDLAGSGLTGTLRLVLQSGAQDHVGDLLGWATVHLGAPASTTSTGSSTTSTTTTTTTTTGATSGLVTGAAAAALPTSAPKPPYRAFSALDPQAHGAVTGAVDAGVLTLTLDQDATSAGEPVYVYVYAPSGVSPVGWARLDDDLRLRVDLSAFTGFVGVTVQAEDGRLLGWTAAGLGSSTTTTEQTTTPAAATAPPAAATTDRRLVGATDGVLLALGALVLAAASLLTARRPGHGAVA